MIFSSVSLVKVYVTIFIVILSTIFYEAYSQISYVKKQRRQALFSFYDENADNVTYSDALETRFSEKKTAMANILRMKAQIKMINTKQKIFNAYHLGPINPKTFVIVIQVHANIFYFRELLESLKNVNAIKKSLLIFSHDYYDDDINRLIKNITFAKYTQIFYPFSIQLHPEIFPGTDPHFCTEEFDCVISNTRDPEGAQSKNYWWWQVNHIFDHLDATKDYNGTILFIEEDNYVTEDLIFVLRLLQVVRNESCPHCEMLSLGANVPSLSQYNVYNGDVSIKTWDNLIYKTGLAFDRKVWDIIKGSSYDFCNFNDYNWDNSLKYIAAKRQGEFWVVAIDGPRVFRFEKCDEDNAGCKIEQKVDEVKKFVRIITRGLYPARAKLNVTEVYKFEPIASGFFDDVRDRELCMYFTKYEVLF